MDIFIYRAKNLFGKNLIGKFKGTGVNALVEYLHSREYFLIQYFSIRLSLDIRVNGRVNYKEISVFSKQFAILLQSGISIIEGLSLLGVQSSSRILRDFLKQVIDCLQRGETLYNAFTTAKRILPEFFLNMIKVGEESGKLEDVLFQLSSYFEKENKIIKKIQSSLLYPLIVFSLTLVISVALLAFIVPNFTEMLKSMNCSIQGITLVVMEVSSFTRKNLPLVVILLVFLLSYIAYLYNSLPYRMNSSGIFQRIPVISSLYRRKLVLNISRSMSMMLSSGLNLVNALNLITNMINSKYFREKIISVSKEVNSGCFLWKAFEESGIFDKLSLSMIRIGEETGNLDNLFKKLGDIVEEETYEFTDKLTELVQPVMLLVLALIVGTMVASMMLPMFSIMDSIS